MVVMTVTVVWKDGDDGVDVGGETIFNLIKCKLLSKLKQNNKDKKSLSIM